MTPDQAFDLYCHMRTARQIDEQELVFVAQNLARGNRAMHFALYIAWYNVKYGIVCPNGETRERKKTVLYGRESHCILDFSVLCMVHEIYFQIAIFGCL